LLSEVSNAYGLGQMESVAADRGKRVIGLVIAVWKVVCRV
jgi:hypothetical protein